jgi:aspartyl-tRNA synthetase
MSIPWENRSYCGKLVADGAGKKVHLFGWVDAIRDHGQILFIHLRDISGIVQVVFDLEKKHFATVTDLREEYVLEVQGKVRLREKGTENPNIQTGKIEVVATSVNILSQSKGLPFQISEKAMVYGESLKANPDKVDEELRLQYRYLDLRRPSMQSHLIKRHQITRCIREYLDKQGFLELETPFLTKSTPEGARDYLVPSRVHPGRFYALPQSPQLFKQLFMMSGMERYFQIVRCFRDEDLRPNRQPEFTQLDLEASFIDEEFIYRLVEELTVKMFAVNDIRLPQPFPRITYQEAMDRYGSDRPDLRIDMEFREVTDIVRHTSYTIFKRLIDKNGLVKGFCIKGQAKTLSKNLLQNEYAMKIAPAFGAQGMTWMKVVKEELESNIAQFFSSREKEELIRIFKAEEGDVLILVADSSPQMVNSVLGNLRLHFADRLNIIPKNLYRPLWVTDFPLFEPDGEKITSVHHPFTSPDRIDFDPQNRADLLSLKSRAYDLVVNGEELGGGSIRIHRMDVQQKIFNALGLGKREVENKFGFFLRALEYGAPPHGGLALGLDRVVAMILGTASIREVIPFPKNRSAVCPLTKAPSEVDYRQLEELELTSALFATTGEEYPEESGVSAEADQDEKAEKITESEVRHVARLARLSLEDEEVDRYKSDLNSILKYVEILEELDTEKIAPMHHVLPIKNVWREDQVKDAKMSGEILKNAPDQEEGYIKVPRILEG